jgi:hypothetical protein
MRRLEPTRRTLRDAGQVCENSSIPWQIPSVNMYSTVRIPDHPLNPDYNTVYARSTNFEEAGELLHTAGSDDNDVEYALSALEMSGLDHIVPGESPG